MFAFLKLISPRGWLALGVLLAVVAFGLTIMALVEAKGTIKTLRADLKACNGHTAALEKQIKDTAVQGGKDYEKLEADGLDRCRAAYDAGAKRLRDDEAVKAGRYLPGSSPSPAHR